MSPQEHFLNGRIVGMPEAVHRTWGFHMRSGTGVTHLCTKPPHLRMRALARAAKGNQDDDSDADVDNIAANNNGTDGSDGGDSGASDGDYCSDTEGERQSCNLQFIDGTIEQYENRPIEHDLSPPFDSMLYPDFHRRYFV